MTTMMMMMLISPLNELSVDIVLQTPAFLSDRVRFETDCTVSRDWVEFDAIKIFGLKSPSSTWVKSDFSWAQRLQFHSHWQMSLLTRVGLLSCIELFSAVLETWWETSATQAHLNRCMSECIHLKKLSLKLCIMDPFFTKVPNCKITLLYLSNRHCRFFCYNAQAKMTLVATGNVY